MFKILCLNFNNITILILKFINKFVSLASLLIGEGLISSMDSISK